MTKKTIVKGALCIFAVVLVSAILGQLPGGNRDMALAQGMKSKMNEILGVIDIVEEAASKGFSVKNIQQKVFAKFDIVAKGMTVVSIPVPLSGMTNEGVVYVKTILPLDLPKEESTIYLWKNGQQIPISRTSQAESDVDAQLALDKGTNYLCFLVKNKNQWWGRSRVLKIESPGAEIKKEDPPPPPPFTDYWDEANSKNFGSIPKKDSVLSFMGFTITSRGQIVTDIPQPLSGSTSEGVVDSNLAMPNNLTGAGNVIYLWNNGEEVLIGKNVSSGHRILSKVVLAHGNNYICGVVKNSGKYIGRTPMVRVSSSVLSSIARFEMTWDGPGDMDLHLDSDAGWHVSFMQTNINQQGYQANLDIDNMSGWGPENIRLFSLPGKSNVRCFVNYYSGNSVINVTVRYFDKNNKMVKAETKALNPGNRISSSQFGGNSWVVGTFAVEP